MAIAAQRDGLERYHKPECHGGSSFPYHPFFTSLSLSVPLAIAIAFTFTGPVPRERGVAPRLGCAAWGIYLGLRNQVEGLRYCRDARESEFKLDGESDGRLGQEANLATCFGGEHPHVSLTISHRSAGVPKTWIPQLQRLSRWTPLEA